jgi:cystathionine beta-lyase/cystathionine gamma-synthase
LAPSTSPQDGLLRLSVGLEDVWDDLAHALAAARMRAAA